MYELDLFKHIDLNSGSGIFLLLFFATQLEFGKKLYKSALSVINRINARTNFDTDWSSGNCYATQQSKNFSIVGEESRLLHVNITYWDIDIDPKSKMNLLAGLLLLLLFHFKKSC